MAISIFQQPTLNSATEYRGYAIHWRKHFVWGVTQSSNVSTYFKHRFILRVYLGFSTTGTLLATIKQPWNGYETTTGIDRRAFFDIRDIIATYLFHTTMDWNTSFPNERPIHFVGCTDNDPAKPISFSRYIMRRFEVEAWEEYATTATGTPEEPAGTKPDFVFNGVNATFNPSVLDTDVADMSMEENSWYNAHFLSGTSDNLLTDVPTGAQVDSRFDLSTIASGGEDLRGDTNKRIQFVAPYDAMTSALYNNTNVDFIQIQVFFKSVGNVIYTIANTAANGGDTNPSTDPERILHFGIGPKNLAEQTVETDLATAMSGTDWVYYKLQIVSSTSAKSRVYYFVKDEYSHAYNCLNGSQATETSRNNRIRLAWVNSSGCWDYFTFNCKNTSEITSKNKVLRHTPVGTFNTEYYNENPLQTTTSVQGVEVKTQMTLNTGYISEEEGEWLQWLFKSPIVHYIRKNSTESTVPAQILDTKMKKQTSINDGCKIQYTIKIEISKSDNTVVR